MEEVTDHRIYFSGKRDMLYFHYEQMISYKMTAPEPIFMPQIRYLIVNPKRILGEGYGTVGHLALCVDIKAINCIKAQTAGEFANYPSTIPPAEKWRKVVPYEQIIARRLIILDL